MSEESARREKVIRLVKDLTLGSDCGESKVPAAVSDFILQEYGLSAKANAENVSDKEMFELVGEIEDMIIVKRDGARKKCGEANGIDGNAENNFMKACKTFIKVKNDYFQVSLELISLLNEINEFRGKYSNHLKDKAAKKQGELKLLEKKMHFLKLTSLHKLYTERNAFPAYVKLMQVLTQRLKRLELESDNLHELDVKYNEVKDNKAYCDLLSTYKKLLIKEKKLDFALN